MSLGDEMIQIVLVDVIVIIGTSALVLGLTAIAASTAITSQLAAEGPQEMGSFINFELF